MVDVVVMMLGMLVHAANPERSLVMLSGGGVEVGISPRLAGRVVIVRRPGGPNALLADPATWGPDERVPGLTAGWDFKPYNGHIVWIGPQRQWWMHQNFATDKRDRKDNWPPDPWGEYAAFQVVQQSATMAALSGPPSPVTGLQLRKEVRIEPDGSVRVKVMAHNVRNEIVRWDLWSNTRVPGNNQVFVAMDKASQIRMEHASSSPWTQTTMDYTIVDGWFTLSADEPLPVGTNARVTKAFLTPSRGIIAAFGQGQVFVKRFNVTPADRMAPDQSPVEIYQNANRDPQAALLELEAHGPYTNLSHNGMMTFEEVWNLVEDAGAADPSSRAARLNSMFPLQ